MSDNKIIKFDDFARFLNLQSGSHICPICGSGEWDLHTPEHAMVTSPDGKMKQNIVPTIPGSTRINNNDEPQNKLFQTPVLNLLVMTCNKCGYVNLFNYQKVKNALAVESDDNSNQGTTDEPAGK